MLLGHFFVPGLFLLLGFSRIFWFALLIVGVLLLINAMRTRASRPTYPYYPQAPQPQISAMELLRQRYARGEIDGVTFDQMRERLEASQPMQQQQQ
ncbi:MAG TPA: SHOCT domain-containing protein [Ktedonobacteraceae bacterium]|jgi:uncharacterized membrane protein|nr:SHOCT domain-containing protein [Ktedonobacteraceae bacterium]